MEEETLIDEARKIHRTLLYLNKTDEITAIAIESFPSDFLLEHDFFDKNLFTEEILTDFFGDDEDELIGALHLFITQANAVIDGFPMKNRQDIMKFQHRGRESDDDKRKKQLLENRRNFEEAEKVEEEEAKKKKKYFSQMQVF